MASVIKEVPVFRAPQINEDETLLMFDTTRTGQSYVGESTTLGKRYTIDMLLDEPGDSCTRILILNTKTLRSSDVTEHFADAWLKRLDTEEHGIELDDEVRFPAYVKTSRAWAVWRDDLEAERPIEDADTESAIRRDLSAIASARRPDMSRKSRAEAANV